MANLGDFDANEHESEYAAIPAGWQELAIISSEMKASTKGGEYLALTVEVLSGPHKGKKAFPKLNLKNQNKDTEKWARIALADICRAVGILHPRDSSELHNKPLMGKLSVNPETDQYPASNDVKAWKAIGGAVGTPENPIPVLMPSALATAVAERSGKKPWEK